MKCSWIRAQAFSRHTKGVVVVAEEFHNSIRLSQQQRSQILQSMNRNSVGVADSRRQHTRHPYEIERVPVVVFNAEGEQSKFIVCTRNISSGGLAFLHGGFLYPGSKCAVTLRSVWGEQQVLVGNIVNCRHIEKHIHEFSIKFTEPIDVRCFLTLDGEQPLRSADEASVPGEENGLTGAVLMIDPSEINAPLVRHYLKGTQVELVNEITVEEGIVALRSSRFDAVLIAFGSVDREPDELVREFRESGFNGSLICATSTPESDQAKAALNAGANEIIPIPITPQSLHRILNTCMNGDAGDFGPIPSQLPYSPDAVELVQNYLEHVSKLAGEIEAAAASDDLELLGKRCDSIAQSASGYGFPMLEEAAKELQQGLSDTPAVDAIKDQLQRLQQICSRLAPMASE